MSDSFSISSSPSELGCRQRHRDLQRVGDQARKLLAEIRSLSVAGRHGRKYRRVLHYLNCDVAKLWAAHRVLPFTATDMEIQELARRVNPFVIEQSHVLLHRQRKRSGLGYRPICELPPTLKAAHYLIKDVVEAHFEPLPHLFDVSGKGRDKAALAVKAALEDGYDRCFIGDVRDCYQHVSASALPDHLPLPKSVVRHALDYRCLTFARRGRHGIYDDWPQAGGTRWNGPRLLQGSPASSIILAKLFNSMAAHIAPHDCVLITSSDNIFVAAQSDVLLQEIIALIREYLHEHPAGPFDLKYDSRTVPPKDEFEFLGYRFVTTPPGVVIEPSYGGELRMAAAIEDAKARDIARQDDFASETVGVINDYFSGYRSITNWNEQRIDLIREAQEDVFFAEVERYVEECTRRTRFRSSANPS